MNKDSPSHINNATNRKTEAAGLELVSITQRKEMPLFLLALSGMLNAQNGHSVLS